MGEKDLKDGSKGLKEGQEVMVTYDVKEKDNVKENVASKVLVTSFRKKNP